MFNTDFTYLKSVERAPELATAWGHNQALKWQHKALQHTAEAVCWALDSGHCHTRNVWVTRARCFPANFYHLFGVFILYDGHGGAAPNFGPSSNPFMPVLCATPLSLLQAAAIIPNQCLLLSCQCREYFI